MSARDRPVRERKFTDKGAEFESGLCRQQFSDAVSRWEKALGTAELSYLQRELESVVSIYQRSRAVLGDELKPRTDELIQETENLFSKLRPHLGESEQMSGVNIQKSSSRQSRPSRHSSRASRHSSQIAQAAVEAAELRAQLKFSEAESKAKAELDKVRLERKLAVAESKVEVLMSVAGDDVSSSSSYSSVSEHIKQQVVSEYLAGLPNAFDKTTVEGFPINPVHKSMDRDNPTGLVGSQIVSGYNEFGLADTNGNQGDTLVDHDRVHVYSDDPVNLFDNSTVNPIQGFVASSSHVMANMQNENATAPPIGGVTFANPSVASSVLPTVMRGGANYTDQVVSQPPVVRQKSLTRPTTYRHLGRAPILQPKSTSAQPLVNQACGTDLVYDRDLLATLVKARLPIAEPSVFTGDVLKYAEWRSSFNALIDKPGVSSSEKIYYLKKYVGGEARECIEGFLYVYSDSSYEEAMQMLNERYGNPFSISMAFRNKIESWNKISGKDNVGLRKFADFLKQCLSASRVLGNLSVMNDEKENQKILRVLPDWVTNRWARIVTDSMREKMVFPPFSDFVSFLSKEADIACNPVTSFQSLHSEKQKSKDKVKTSKSFASKSAAPKSTTSKSTVSKTTAPNSMASNSTEQSKTISPCLFCSESHYLDLCPKLRKKPYEDRTKFMFDKRLCFGCCRRGHITKACLHKLFCCECKKRHPTVLHVDRPGETSVKQLVGHSLVNHVDAPEFSPISSQSFLSHQSGHQFSSMIVPVWLSHVSNPSRELLVYCLLDSQSDSTFLLEKTADELNVSGPQVSLLLSTMLAEDKLIDSSKVGGLQVRSYDGVSCLSLPPAYTRSIIPANRDHIPTPEIVDSWPHLYPIRDKLVSLQDCDIGLLIGYNCARALVPLEVIPPVEDGPFAQRGLLGWTVIGTVSNELNETEHSTSHGILSSQNIDPLPAPRVQFTLRSKVKEVKNASPSDVIKVLEKDFNDIVSSSEAKLSMEDCRFLETLENNLCLSESDQYIMPLPFKSDVEPCFPDSLSLALKRLQFLVKRLEKDKTLHDHYVTFMNDMLEKGYAEEVPESEIDSSRCFYIPHHGVYHKKKPDKVRVVFDCSSRCNGVSLNDTLLQGPDLLNNLLGVLCRFRKEHIAISCDVEKMFYQFKVQPNHRDYLRFLWFANSNISDQPKHFRMTVHLFGAVSSPGCANFGMKKAADEGESKFGSAAADFVRRNFYVDDGLTSVPTSFDAIDLVNKTQRLCYNRGIRLHKFCSNSKDVLQAIPVEDRCQSLQNLSIDKSDNLVERTLGVEWSVMSDCFQFKVVLKEKPLSRRGILSTISSVFDPLGFVSPFILQGKHILQDLCRQNVDWDVPVSKEIESKWLAWKSEILFLHDVKIDRCIKPQVLVDISAVEFHHFSDASTLGYGQCSYVRLFDVRGQVHVSLVFAKSRVAPLKQLSIPRLELTAALLSVKVSSFLNSEYSFSNVKNFYYTDSQVVLGYIGNQAKRFHVFVANRVQQIKDSTSISEWVFVNGDDNPADIASRGASVQRLLTDTCWFRGPAFLWDPEFVPQAWLDTHGCVLSSNDPEVKKTVSVLHANIKSESNHPSLLEVFDRFSSWYRLKKAIALCLKFAKFLRDKMSQSKVSLYQSVTVEDLRVAEIKILRIVQDQCFRSELSQLKEYGNIRKSSKLHQFSCFLDSDGVLRLGGRLTHGDLTYDEKFPVILPKCSTVTSLVIGHCHSKVAHQGKSFTLNEIRSQGYWIINASSVVAKFIFSCIVCRKIRGKLVDQKMSDLPSDRVSSSPCFTFCACDYFGPFIVKQGRKEVKRYGVLFVCMFSRAVHLEVSDSLTTDSFINALRRFISIRGPIRILRCDNATNFVGARNEFSSHRVHEFLKSQGCDFEFCFNVPSASHMAGSWERLIRTIRSILSGILTNHGTQLDDEGLRTFLCEAAAIANNRPLSVENLNDPSLSPLTPNSLLTMKSHIVIEPPVECDFSNVDLYVRKRWRRIQYLAQVFWSRFKFEYLSQLQLRQKWIKNRRNLSVGDVVILKEDTSRDMWPLAKVVEVFPSKDGLVRSVRIQVGTQNLNSNGKRQCNLSSLVRPVHKLVLLVEHN